MKPLASIALATFVLGTSARADWLLSDYSTPTADSSSLNALYGIRTYSNPASTTRATVPVAGSLKVEATFASEGTQGYTAELGVLHPLTPDWMGVDISASQGIEFEIKTSVKPTDGWEIAIGSPIYPDELSSRGTVLSTAFPVAAAGTWMRVVITPDMFAYPSWFCDDVTRLCPSITLPEVMQSATHLKISPRTKYRSAGVQGGTPCTACVGPTTMAMTFEIRNIKILGETFPPPPPPPPPPPTSGCLDDQPAWLVDGFDGDNQNELGGRWRAYSDTSAWAAYDTTRGISVAALDFERTGSALLTATLEREVPQIYGYGSYHTSAGWAGVTTDFGRNVSRDLSGLTGFSFRVTPYAWDPNASFLFKVLMDGLPDEAAYQVRIPGQLLNGDRVCVSLDDLRQPAKAYPKVDLDLSRIRGLSWEASLANHYDYSVRAAYVQFQLDSVYLQGLEPSAIAPRNRRQAGRSFQPQYARGELKLSGLEDGFRNVEILAIDGARVGSYAIQGGIARVDLRPGAYVIVARDAAGRARTSSLAVLGGFAGAAR